MKSGLGQVRRKTLFSETIMDKKFETNSSFHVKKGHYKKSLMSIVMEIFASIDKIFSLGRSLSTRV